MKRRDFVGIAAASIFAPKFGRWYRQGSGLMVRDVEVNGASYLTPDMRQILTVQSVTEHGGMGWTLTARHDKTCWIAFHETSAVVREGKPFRVGDRIRLLGGWS